MSFTIINLKMVKRSTKLLKKTKELVPFVQMKDQKIHLFFKCILFIYLAVPNLSCGMWDLRPLLIHVESLVCVCVCMLSHVRLFLTP